MPYRSGCAVFCWSQQSNRAGAQQQQKASAGTRSPLHFLSRASASPKHRDEVFILMFLNSMYVLCYLLKIQQSVFKLAK